LRANIKVFIDIYQKYLIFVANPAIHCKSAVKKLFLLVAFLASKVAIRRPQKQAFLLYGLSVSIRASGTFVQPRLRYKFLLRNLGSI
jgi:hypothetical protein